MLDAAELIVVDGGYEALTLTAVAKRSGSSIGSLYRFFSSKEQVLEAVVGRLAAAVETSATAARLQVFDELSVREFVTYATDWIAPVLARHPALPALLRHFGDYCEPLEELAMEPIRTFLESHATHLKPKSRNLTARMALKIIEGGVALRPDPSGASIRAALREMRLALEAYLEAKIAETVD